MADPLPDWTEGNAGIVLNRCDPCKHIFYFEREFCPVCGARSNSGFSASGLGVVEARTEVKRAATVELSAFAPYTIILVKLAEGPRIMAHGEKDLAIRDQVSVRFVPFGDGNLIPYFKKIEARDE
jgi:uncharacterized OB-fold protein